MRELTFLSPEQDKAPINSLITYLLSKLSSKATDFHAALTSLLSTPAASPEDSTSAEPKHVGLVLSERLVNMPPQVVPPMYRMLQEELEWARNDVSVRLRGFSLTLGLELKES